MAAGSENPQPTKNDVLILSCLKVWGHSSNPLTMWGSSQVVTYKRLLGPNPRDLVRSVVPFPDTSLGPGPRKWWRKTPVGSSAFMHRTQWCVGFYIFFQFQSVDLSVLRLNSVHHPNSNGFFVGCTKLHRSRSLAVLFLQFRRDFLLTFAPSRSAARAGEDRKGLVPDEPCHPKCQKTWENHWICGANDGVIRLNSVQYIL